MEKKNDWERRAARWVCIALALLGAYLALQYGTAILLAFGLALAIAMIVYPLSVRASRFFHLPQRLLAIVFVLLLLALLITGASLLLVQIGKEVQELLSHWEHGQDGVTGALERLWERVMIRLESLPLIGSLARLLRSPSSEHAMGSFLSDMLQKMLSEIGSTCSTAIGRMLRATPRFFVGVLVTVMATFYLSADYGTLCQRFEALFSPETGARIRHLRSGAGRALRRYVRAYLLLFFLTFAEALIGLFLLRRPYALLFALAIALVDLLPVLGAGTVLIPWALGSLLFGNYQTGLGLLILYGVMTMIRQIAEPHLVGGSLGLHPFVTLFFMFIGFELFGVFGMLISPGVALLIKELFCKSEADSS